MNDKEIEKLRAETADLRAKITRDTEAQAKTLDACYQKVKELEKELEEAKDLLKEVSIGISSGDIDKYHNANLKLKTYLYDNN